MPPEAYATSSHIQPRYSRQSSTIPTPPTTPSKTRFIPRHKLLAPAHPLDPILSALHIRRTKRTRLCLGLAVLSLALLLLFAISLTFSNPISLDTISSHTSYHSPFNTSLGHSIFGNAPTVLHPGDGQHHDATHDEVAHQPLDAEKAQLLHKDPQHQDATNDTDDKLTIEHIAGHLPVRADVSAMNSARKKYTEGKMSIIVLFHSEYDSMRPVLKSWIDGGLVDYVDEVLFFLNGVRSEEEFRQRIPDYDARIPEGKRRVHLSPENLPLGLAICKMVELASHDYVLLLEKDWQLIEPQDIMKSRLDDSKVMVGSGVSDVVRHRHRSNPGVPLHALIMHQGREQSIIRQQKNLLCFVHHWQKDPPNMYPGQGHMYRCGGVDNHVEEVDIYCSSSVYCQWNNNPGVFKKQWFTDEVGERYKKEYEIEFKKYGKKSPFLDFEYYTNWRSYAWTDRNFTVAVGTGLFSHAESEHRHFNTFWYAHFRLTVDLTEIRNLYLKNETKFKQLGGVHYDPESPKPPTMMERYPVDFARKFHFKDMFIGNLETQKNMINDVYARYQQNHRFLSVSDWESGGRDSEKYKRPISWRTWITTFHHTAEKAMMMAPPKQPHEMSITLVTCLLDIGRHGLAKDAFQFRRDFKMYLDAMEGWLTHKYQKVVYTSQNIVDEMMRTMSEESKASTKFVITTREELRSKWLGPDNYDKVQELRTAPEWRARASWLVNSPQGALSDYNALVMSKMFMMRDAARQNYWGTSHFLFLDAKHNCRRPKKMTPKNDHIIRAHMFDKFLLTTFDYTPSTEVHGFEYKAFNKYCNRQNTDKRQLVKIGRGGIFGGSAFVLEFISAMYDVALTATLREGLMGTEENILSILKYQVQHYVDDFSNNWACPDKIEGDHTCKNLKHQGYNCAIFDWVSRNAVDDDGKQ